MTGFPGSSQVATHLWGSEAALELPGAPGKPSSRAALPGPLTGRVSPTAMLDEDEEERVDETALRQLTEMGFPESRAVKALRLNQYVGPGGWWRVCPADPPVPLSLRPGRCALFQRGA